MNNMKEMLNSLVDTPSTEAISNSENEISVDPIKCLPEEILIFIFDYLSVTEVLQATEVSKLWKCFIESNQRIFNRVMDQVVAKADITNMNLATVLKCLENRRLYKHMRSIFSFEHNLKDQQDFVFDRIIFPFGHYAGSLVTLELDLSFVVLKKSHVPQLRVNFPKLKKLKISCITERCSNNHPLTIKNFINLSKFPSLTHLNVCACLGYVICSEFLKIPKLEFLIIEKDENNATNNDSLRKFRRRKCDLVNNTKAETQFNMLVISYANTELLALMSTSLTHLQINSNINYVQLCFVLSFLKNLKEFQFGIVTDLSRSLRVIYGQLIHQNLEVIYMGTAETKDVVERPEFDHVITTFLSQHVPSLKKLFCTQMSEDILVLRNSDPARIKFDIVIDPDLQFDKVSGKF